ncbi:MAG: MoxR family ATPase [Rhodospirillaceae bacterium]|nr:MAG: MoxR family ATPase [Rhodospirillaceae bacterium]
MTALPANIDATVELLRQGGYVADRALATPLYLALALQRPLFLEGEAGVGKTEIAKVLAATLGRDLVRLQCYEGLDIAAAVYEWNYPRQMMAIRLAEAAGRGQDQSIVKDIYGADFLIKRPLLAALEPHAKGAPILLIDEIDRTDEPFEAFLLEVLSDYQISIPELGTVHAATPPIVILTSNRTREIHDALKRRCLYHWLDYPNAERERAILAARLPKVGERLTAQVVAFVQALRAMELFKPPGIAESLDWAQALLVLDAGEIDRGIVDATLGVLLKYQDDIARVRGEIATRGVAPFLSGPVEPAVAAQ